MLPALTVAALVLTLGAPIPPGSARIPGRSPARSTGAAVMLQAARTAASVGAGRLGPASAPTAAGSARTAAAPQPVPAGQGVWPLQPRPPVVRPFDPPEGPYGAGHRGVDLLGAPGQPVRTSLPGRVTFAAPLAGRGVVVVDHGSVRTTYEPVAATVPVGAAVARGQPIGTLQPGGSHCAPRSCLHWGLLRGPQYLDPLVLVYGLPVRLLPLADRW